MEIKGNTVTFELDDVSMHMLQLSLAILEKSGDELFKEFVERNCYIAMRNKFHVSEGFNPYLSSNRPNKENPEERAKRRIEMWSARKGFVNYNIIKSFFIVRDRLGLNIVTRDEMLSAYKTLSFVNKERNDELTFIRNFRMMCSDRAYGIIFKYNSDNDEVTINKEIEAWLVDRKDLFTN